MVPGHSKECPDCGQAKPEEQFYAHLSTGCNNARGAVSVKRLHGRARHYHLTRRYGIGADEVRVLVARQGGVCAICRAAPAEQVGHDHTTKAVRGALCFNCNGGLGRLRDDRDRLARAIDYLEGEVWRAERTAPGVYRLCS